MEFEFSREDITKIGEILNRESETSGDSHTYTLNNQATKQSLTLSIHNNVELGTDVTGALVVAQTQHGYFELHSCNGFMVFEPDEVIFISSQGPFISSMVVGRECTCSMFVNIRKEILSSDFGKLDPRVLMAAMQLSLTEEIIPAGQDA